MHTTTKIGTDSGMRKKPETPRLVSFGYGTNSPEFPALSPSGLYRVEMRGNLTVPMRYLCERQGTFHIGCFDSRNTTLAQWDGVVRASWHRPYFWHERARAFMLGSDSSE